MLTTWRGKSPVPPVCQRALSNFYKFEPIHEIVKTHVNLPSLKEKVLVVPVRTGTPIDRGPGRTLFPPGVRRAPGEGFIPFTYNPAVAHGRKLPFLECYTLHPSIVSKLSNS